MDNLAGGGKAVLANFSYREYFFQRQVVQDISDFLRIFCFCFLSISSWISSGHWPFLFLLLNLPFSFTVISGSYCSSTSGSHAVF